MQYFAIVLFECAEADDFSPAKSLMNMCFTFYYESKYSYRRCDICCFDPKKFGKMIWSKIN